MNGRLNLSIVGLNQLVYEAELVCDTVIRSNKSSVLIRNENEFFSSLINRSSSPVAHLKQFVIHSALDMVEDKVKEEDSYFLRCVDDFNNYKIFGWLMGCGTKFLLLYEMPNGITKGKLSRLEDCCRVFFTHLNALYLKLIQNPFYSQDDVVTSLEFDNKVEGLAQKYLFSL